MSSALHFLLKEINEITNQFGPPVIRNPNKLNRLLSDFKQSLFNNQKFFVLTNPKPNQQYDNWKIDTYLYENPISTFFVIFYAIHDEYRMEYARWIISSYKLMIEMDKELESLKHCFKIMVPMKIRPQEEIFWVLQETFLCYRDENGNPVSQLNIFTPICKFTDNNKIGISGSIWHLQDSIPDLDKRWQDLRYSMDKYAKFEEREKLILGAYEYYFLMQSLPEKDFREKIMQEPFINLKHDNFKKCLYNIGLKVKNHYNISGKTRYYMVDIIRLLNEKGISYLEYFEEEKRKSGN